MREKINKEANIFIRISLVIFLLTASGFLLAKIFSFFYVLPREASSHRYVKQENFQEKQCSAFDAKAPSLINVAGDNSLEILSILAAMGAIVAYVFNFVVKKEIEDN